MHDHDDNGSGFQPIHTRDFTNETICQMEASVEMYRPVYLYKMVSYFFQSGHKVTEVYSIHPILNETTLISDNF